MTDEELIEQAQSLPLIYVDGFGAYRKMNGVLRCVGFVLQGGATLNLAVSLLGADDAQLRTARTLHDEQPKAITVWNERLLSH